MIKIKLVVLLQLIICRTYMLYAQDSTEFSIEHIQENIANIISQNDEDLNLEDIADYLYQLSSQPVKINSNNENELKRLFWLTDIQINNIQKYIKKSGSIQSIYEIPNIEGFTINDAQLIGPFIIFSVTEKKNNLQDLLKLPRQTLIIRTGSVIEQQKGYKSATEDGFLGNSKSIYCRYHIYNHNFSAGITGDKDPGEEFFAGNNPKGFDFYSFHLQFNNIGFIKSFVLGDYKINIGNGLIAGSSFSLGKNPFIMGNSFQNSGITKYTATDENRFFRGTALTLGYKKKELSLFYSQNWLDANIIAYDSASNEVIEVSTLQNSGYHATYNDLMDKNAIKNVVYGGHIKLAGNIAEFGLTAIIQSFSAKINPPNEPYNIHYFRGTDNINIGLNFRIRTGYLLWFGETAASKNKSFAAICGLQAQPVSRLQLNVIYRNYGKAYHSFYSNAFGENTKNQNERGLYLGFKSNLMKYITLSGYADFFIFPELKFDADFPSLGHEYMGCITFNPSTYFQTLIQYRIKQKETNLLSDEMPLAKLVPTLKENLRLGINYKVNQNLKLGNRIEYTTYKKGENKVIGFFASQDLDVKLPRWPLQFYIRYALFDTEDYDSRIYAYENGLLYTFSIPSFYDKGTRFSLLVKYSPFDNTNIGFHYSITKYTNRETVGSGLNEIEGNTKQEIKIQAIFKLNKNKNAIKP